jgi:hypothetical protein
MPFTHVIFMDCQGVNDKKLPHLKVTTIHSLPGKLFYLSSKTFRHYGFDIAEG